MKKYLPIYLFIFCIVILVVCSSCRKDFEYPASMGNLSFSKDTVFLDTIFSNISSPTYSLKVYNKSANDLQIPFITLAKGVNSHYRINVAGQAGITFENIPIRAKDSMFIFIETTVDVSENNSREFLATDAILFDRGSHQQEVSLVTLVKDAIFLYPLKNSLGIRETVVLNSTDEIQSFKVSGFELEDDELNFTNDKPYVIYGYAAVPENKSLTIAAGARIYFHKNSGLLVQKNSSLKVNGLLSTDQQLLENEVIFEGDRLTADFSDVAGQWGSIWLDKESYGNSIHHLTIKNATTGIFVQGNTNSDSLNLQISNSQIYNSALTNLWCTSAKVAAKNVILGNAGVSSLHINQGGSYAFTHCTIANYWAKSFRTGTALRIYNSTNTSLLRANFLNCIIDGSKNSEVTLENNGELAFNFLFKHCMLKIASSSSSAPNRLYDVSNLNNYQTVFLNENAHFLNLNQHNFRLEPSSFAIGKGSLEGAIVVPKDLSGKDRNTEITLGAYQF